MTSTVYEGYGDASDLSIAIVASRFNDLITRALVDGATSGLKRCGLSDNKVTLVWVPGAFELPLVAEELASNGRYDAIICVGAVVRGATDHYDYVCQAAASGIAQVGLRHKLPVIFGVLTTSTVEQALERAGGKGSNKGYESALAAVEMALLMRQLQASHALS